MKITDIQLHILELPDSKSSAYRLEEVPNLDRIQYRHAGASSDRPQQQAFLKVFTDDDLVGIATAPTDRHYVEILKHNVLGEDPLHRERLYQKLLKGTRWVYQTPGWFGPFDNCLWDIAGRKAGLPVYALAGKVRDRFPMYLTGGDTDVAGYLDQIRSGQEVGIQAYKLHSYKGGKADISILRSIREEVGPDYGLLHDPVCSYSFREAVEVGRVMEELDFIWLEEPFHEQKLNLYQQLCDTLTIPVMGNEMLMHDVMLSSQWLIAGATDRLRGNARSGTTAVLKMAHLAELHGTNIELNGIGGLSGLIHAHLGCCIDNTEYYECSGRYRGRDGHRKDGEKWGLLSAPLVDDGHLAPPDTPGWGAEWDQKRFKSLTVEVV